MQCCSLFIIIFLFFPNFLFLFSCFFFQFLVSLSGSLSCLGCKQGLNPVSLAKAENCADERGEVED